MEKSLRGKGLTISELEAEEDLNEDLDLDKNISEKAERTFEDLLDGEFTNTHEIKSNDSHDEEGKFSIALFSFTKESSLANTEQRLNFESIPLKKSQVRPLSRDRKTREAEPKKNPGIPNASSPISVMISPRSNGLNKDKICLKEFQNIIHKQQEAIIKKDIHIQKLKDSYEKKIRELEQNVSNLNKKLNTFKRPKNKSLSYSHSPLISSKNHSKYPSTEYSPSDVKKEIFYPNGSKAEIYPNGYRVTYYANNDIKQEHPDGASVYFFANEQTTKTTLKNGLQVIKFKNGQTEKLFPDGTIEIIFADGSVRCIFPSGESQTVYQNGKIEKIDRAGVKTVLFKNGTKETYIKSSN